MYRLMDQILRFIFNVLFHVEIEKDKTKCYAFLA